MHLQASRELLAEGRKFPKIDLQRGHKPRLAKKAI